MLHVQRGNARFESGIALWVMGTHQWMATTVCILLGMPIVPVVLTWQSSRAASWQLKRRIGSQEWRGNIVDSKLALRPEAAGTSTSSRSPFSLQMILLFELIWVACRQHVSLSGDTFNKNYDLRRSSFYDLCFDSIQPDSLPASSLDLLWFKFNFHMLSFTKICHQLWITSK